MYLVVTKEQLSRSKQRTVNEARRDANIFASLLLPRRSEPRELPAGFTSCSSISFENISFLLLDEPVFSPQQ